MNTVAMLLLGFLLAGQQPAPGTVDSSYDKKTDFAAIKTYAWERGTDAMLPEAHKMIVGAIEKEMAGLGLTPAASGADVTLAYYTMTLTNVDVKALDKIDQKSTLATRELGKLVVIMRNQKREQIWSAVSREFLDRNRAGLDTAIQAVAARLFSTYPLRARK